MNSDAVAMKRYGEHDIAADDGRLVIHAGQITRFAFVLSPEIPLLDDDGIRAPIKERRPSPPTPLECQGRKWVIIVIWKIPWGQNQI